MLSQRLVVYMYVLKKRNGSKSNVKKKKKSLLCIYEKNKNKKQMNPGKINLRVSLFFFL